MRVDFNAVFNGHANKSNNFPTVSIYSTYMGDTKHHHLLILVNVELVTKVVGTTRDGIKLPSSVGPASMVVTGIDPSQ